MLSPAFFNGALALSSLAAIAQAQGAYEAKTPAGCAACDDVHFFLARGNNEPYPGRQAALVEATCDGLASCGYENLYFSALFTDLYCQTAYDGNIAGLTQMAAYAEQCPNSKLILAGYSQGGQIASDLLAGGGGYSFNGCFQPYTPNIPRDTSPGNKIAAVIIFGDVRHDANQSYNYGNGSAIDGWFPRNSTMLANLNTYADIMRNWCVSTDPICAANQTSYVEASHLDYYNIDSNAAASFIWSVASLTSNAPFTTAIPTSLSGTVQNYATVGTATPSGSVILDTTWTSSSSVVPCTATTYATSTISNSTAIITNGTSLSAAPTSGSDNTLTSTISAPLGAGGPSVAAASNTSTAAPAKQTSTSGASMMVFVQPALLAGSILALALFL